MFRADLILCLLAYGLGLTLTAIDAWQGALSLPAVGVAIVGILCAAIVPRFWRGSPRSSSWILAGAIVVLATLNYHGQMPRPGEQDVSRILQTRSNFRQPVTVQGQIRSIPGVTSSDRVRFELAVDEISQDGQGQSATGCLYVTVPLLQGTGLRPHQTVSVVGRAYEPRPVNNPAGFDFQQYLARQGCFAGLSGQQVEVNTGVDSGVSLDVALQSLPWWRIRQRVIQAQVTALGSPDGALVSAMVLGSSAVDLPSQLRQDFAQVGLAHVLAASGFQVTLLIGCVLWLTQGRSLWIQCGVGGLLLLILLGLTGPQPSIVRAIVMGSVGLVGLALKRRTQPLGLLALAATVLLIVRPLWIWDLGFQLSFLATFGLVATASTIADRLNFLPPRLAELLAVPIAAMIWTIPVLLYQFGVLSPYSLLVNPLTTPLVTVLSLGGIASAVGAVCFVPLGQYLALLLYPFVKALLAIVSFFLHLPGATVAVGSISVVQVILLYGLFVFLWLYRSPGLLLRWGSVAAAVTIALIPNWYSQHNLTQLTIVADTKTPVLILQDGGQAAILNSGGEAAVRYTLLPFLQQQGINRLAWATQSRNSAENREGWLRLWQHLPVDRFGQLPPVPKTSQQGTANTSRTSATSPIAPQQNWKNWSLEALNTALTQQKATIVSLHCDPNSCSPSLDLGDWQVQLLQADGSLWQITEQSQDHDRSLGFALFDLSGQAKLVAQLKTLPTSSSAPWIWWTGEPLQTSVWDAAPWQFALASARKLDPQTIQALNDRQIPLYWTGQDGALQWQPGRSVQATLQN